MFAFLMRFFGYWMLAAAIVALVIDGAKTIAESTLTITPLGQTWFELNAGSLILSQAAIERHVHPFLWDPVIQYLLTLPTWSVAGMIGVAMLLIGRRKEQRHESFA